MSAEVLRRAAVLMREQAKAAEDTWGVPTWRASLSELGDRDGYREAPPYMQTHVATNDVNGSVILASPWTDQAPTIHAASWHPAVALAVADWLDRAADEPWCCDACKYGPDHPENMAHAALAVARAYLGESA